MRRAKLYRAQSLNQLYPDGTVRIARLNHRCTGDERVSGCREPISVGSPYFEATPFDRSSGIPIEPTRFCRHCAGIESVNIDLFPEGRQR